MPKPKHNKELTFISLVLILGLMSLNAQSQTRRKFYNRLDLQVKDFPKSLDTIKNWINPYLKRQFVKSPIYGHGYMHNFKLALRHMDSLALPGSPFIFVPKKFKTDSNEEPFTSLIFVDVKKGREELNEMELSVESYLEMAKKYLGWNNGSALYKTSIYLVNNGEEHKEQEAMMSRISKGYSSGPDKAMPDYGLVKEQRKPHLDYLTDTLNHLLGTSFPYGLGSSKLADSLLTLGYNIENLVKRLYFNNRTAKEQDSLLDLMFHAEGGIKNIEKYFTHKLDISGFPFDLLIPSNKLNSNVRAINYKEGENLLFDIWSCKIEVYPSQLEFNISVSLVGKFYNSEGKEAEKSYLYLKISGAKGKLFRYHPEDKHLETLLNWK